MFGSGVKIAASGTVVVVMESGSSGVRPDDYKPGSKQDFDRLYEQTYPRIFRSLVALTGGPAAAEDCTQEAFLKAFKQWKNWNQSAPAEAWIHRIAINTAISYRRRERLREVGEVLRRLGRPPDPDPTESGIGPDLLREIRRLPPKQGAAIVLRYFHGYTSREIAGILGIPESTVATRLADARKALQARLGRIE
jgi:RNA polymerase sigma-70 factor (ECF subfamily)